MLSVPGAIASERTVKKTFRPTFMEKAAMFFSFLPFLNLNTKGDTSSDTVSNDDSNQKIKITGTATSPKKADGDS